MQTVAIRVHGDITVPLWAELLVSRKASAESKRLARQFGAPVLTIANVGRDRDGKLWVGIVDRLYEVKRDGLQPAGKRA